MTGDNVEVSVVLPAYNEAAIIERTVERTLDALEGFQDPARSEVLVAENGSTDATLELARGLAEAHERVRVVTVPEAGRGRALNVAFEEARGEVLVYFDVDLATDLAHLEELVDAIRHEGFDVATGSRWIDGHEADRPLERAIPSRGFNWMARTFLGSKLRDHQCGFKALDREAFDALAADLPDDNWFWDTELLVRAQHRGLDVKEFPVDWTPKGDSKLHLGRDVLGMGAKTFKLWWPLKAPEALKGRGHQLVSTLLLVTALALLVAYMDLGRLGAALGDTRLELVALAAGVYAISLPVRGLRYQRILSAIGRRITAGLSTAAVCLSQTVNLVAPARSGDAVRAYVVKHRDRVPYTSGFAGLAVERASDLFAIAALVLATLLAAPLLGLVDAKSLAALLHAEGHPVLRQALYGASILLALITVGLLGLAAWHATGRGLPESLREAGASVVDRLPGSRNVRAFLDDVGAAGRTSGALAPVAGYAAAIWLVDSLTAYVVLQAVGVPVAGLSLLTVTVLAVSVANLAKILPLTPGGIGLYEGVFTLVVATLTPLTWPTALAAAIVDHAVKNGVTAAGGLVASAPLNLSIREAVSGEAPTASAAAHPEGNP